MLLFCLKKDIDQSLNAEGSAVYKAVVDGETVGRCCCCIINESTQHNHLTCFFLRTEFRAMVLVRRYGLNWNEYIRTMKVMWKPYAVL